MLTTERYHQTNNNWEDQDEDPKTWADWKASYKKAHTKAHVKAQAAEGTDKFGTTNAAEQVLKNSEVTKDDGGDKVGMEALEGYFENLATAATKKKSVLEKIVANNAKLTATNEEPVAIVKTFPTKKVYPTRYLLPQETGRQRGNTREEVPNLMTPFQKGRLS